uniref:Uncharacterized protein n=1 Tax=Mus spicilegus TaxID=10103 RepID=A0A8C6HLJ7_MUSSI
MKVVILMALLVLTAHCVPVSRFPGKIVLYCPFFNRKHCQRFCEFFKICRKAPVSRRTTVVPSFPLTTEADLSLTGGPLTPTGGEIQDSRVPHSPEKPLPPHSAHATVGSCFQLLPVPQ